MMNTLNKNQNDGKGNIKKQTALLIMPFLFCTVAIVLLSIMLFEVAIRPNVYWSVLIDSSNSGVKSSEVSLEFEPIAPKQIEDAQKVYYDSKDFPKIFWGDKWATLDLPYLKAENVNVFNGDGTDVLANGIGKFFGSSYPGQGGNVVLSFHVNRQKYLYFLENVPVGEKVILNTLYGKYVYIVEKTVIFETTDSSYVTYDESERLTLYTCYPKEGPYRKQRFALICTLDETQSAPAWR